MNMNLLQIKFSFTLFFANPIVFHMCLFSITHKTFSYFMPTFIKAYLWFYRHFYRCTWKLLYRAPKLKYYNCSKSAQPCQKKLPLNAEPFNSICVRYPSTKQPPSSSLLHFKLSVSPHSHFVFAWGDCDKLNPLHFSLHLLGSDSCADILRAIKSEGYLSF